MSTIDSKTVDMSLTMKVKGTLKESCMVGTLLASVTFVGVDRMVANFLPGSLDRGMCTVLMVFRIVFMSSTIYNMYLSE
eukprot:m51a1_g14008 hypothetical protein (79) ;mRNA; r:1078348-1078584